jgi:hypothetical protein
VAKRKRSTRKAASKQPVPLRDTLHEAQRTVRELLDNPRFRTDLEEARKVSERLRKLTTPEQREAARLKHEEARFPGSERAREQCSMTGAATENGDTAAASGSAKPKRAKGGGMKRKLRDDQIEKGKALFRTLLADDPTWAEQREASAVHVKKELNLGVHWRTVQRHIIYPVLNEQLTK